MYACRTLADSIGPHGHRLWTAEITYPRFIHDELMTHRMLSRNTSSSRAVPVEKVIKQVQDNPVIPVSFGKNTRGMVAQEQLSSEDQSAAYDAWIQGSKDAVLAAQRLAFMRVHKQLANRVLMPYTWITTIVSATEWENFFALRTALDAQPEMQRIARMMIEEYYIRSTPVICPYGYWHLPLIEESERDNIFAAQISAARCAAVSYLRQHDIRSVEEWLGVFDKLAYNGHWSPLEHPAYCTVDKGGTGNFRGFAQLRHNYSDTRTFTRKNAEVILDGPI